MHKQKSKMKQNTILKESKGITLIALITTIIILLILAAISIAAFKKEDSGIWSKATEAQRDVKKADLIEKAQQDILGYVRNSRDGDITSEQLKEVLEKYFKNVPEEDELQEKLKEKDFKLKSKPEYGGQDVEIADIYDGDLAK